MTMQIPGALYKSRAVFTSSPYNTSILSGGATAKLRQAGLIRPRSGASDVINTISTLLGVPIAPAPSATDPTDPNWVPPPSGDNPIPGVLGPTSTGTADFIQGHLYLAGVQVAPFVPQNMVQSTLAQVPGFTDPQVYAIVGGTAGPFQVPPNVPQGANYLVSVQRTGASIKGQPLPPNVLWVVDWGAAPGQGQQPSPTPGPQTGPVAPTAAASDTIFGFSPMTVGIAALVGVVGVVLVTSRHEKRTRVSRG